METEAVEITVSLNGTLLSEGQHFTVPSLGLVSDNISIEEYEKQLISCPQILSRKNIPPIAPIHTMHTIRLQALLYVSEHLTIKYTHQLAV